MYRTVDCLPGYCHRSRLQYSNSNGTATTNSPCVYPRLNSLSNTLCGQCAADCVPWGAQCVPCSTVNGSLLFLWLLTSFAVVCFLHRSAGSASGHVNIFLSFVQTIGLQVGRASSWIGWIVFFNFDASALSGNTCLAPLSALEQIMLSLCVPLIMMAELGGMWLVHRTLHRARGSSSSPVRLLTSAAPAYSSSRYVDSAFSVLLFCYAPIVQTCLEYFVCVDVGDDRVIFAHPSIDCRSDAYRGGLVVVLICFCTLVIGLPVWILGTLASAKWRDSRIVPGAMSSLPRSLVDDADFDRPLQRNPSLVLAQSPVATSTHPVTVTQLEHIELHDTHSEQIAPRISSAQSDDDVIVASEPPRPRHSACASDPVSRYPVLFCTFRPHASAWAAVILLRRMLLAILSATLVQAAVNKQMSFGFVHFAFVIAQQLFHPFVDHPLNQMDAISHSALVVVSLLLTAHAQPPFPFAVEVLLTLLICPLALYFVGVILRRQYQEWSSNGKQPQVPSSRDGVPSGLTGAPSQASPAAVELVVRHDTTELESKLAAAKVDG